MTKHKKDILQKRIMDCKNILHMWFLHWFTLKIFFKKFIQFPSIILHDVTVNISDNYLYFFVVISARFQ